MTNPFSPRPDLPIAERTRKRVWIHLIPYLFFLYVLAYLDRINVSVAALELEKSVADGGMGFDKAIIGFGAGIFFWGYWILEIPSTISVLKWGARYVFVRILVLWGLSCALIGAINTPIVNNMFVWLPPIAEDAGVLLALDSVTNVLFGWLAGLFGYNEPLRWFTGLAHDYNLLPHDAEVQFYFLRFMLGFFEGGFFPSVIVYLSLWFRPEDRAKAIASFMAAIPLSSMVGAPLSGYLLEINWFEIEGWRWIFILQGVVPMLAGVATLFMLPDRPAKAHWLPADEREWLENELHREQRGHAHHSILPPLRYMPLVLLLTLAYFCLNITSYGLSMFMPAILKSQAGTMDWFGISSNRWASILTAAPFLVAFVAMQFNGWHSDKTRERIGHVVVPLLGLSAGIFVAALLDGYAWLPVLVMIFVVGACMYTHLPAYWPLPTMFLGSLAAASATGFINMIGNLGGFVGPVLVGKAVTTDGRFAPALYTLAPLPFIAACVVLAVGYYRRGRVAAAAACPPAEAAVSTRPGAIIEPPAT